MLVVSAAYLAMIRKERNDLLVQADGFCPLSEVLEDLGRREQAQNRERILTRVVGSRFRNSGSDAVTNRELGSATYGDVLKLRSDSRGAEERDPVEMLDTKTLDAHAAAQNRDGRRGAGSPLKVRGFAASAQPNRASDH